MGKPIIPEEAFVDMPFPVNGTDVSDAFDSQHPNTTPDAMNVRTFEAITHRARGGSRPGLSKHINQKVGGLTSEIQHLQIIVDPQADALSANFDVSPPGMIDPSTNNVFILGGSIDIKLRRNNNRPVRVGGTGIQPNRYIVPSVAAPGATHIVEVTNPGVISHQTLAVSGRASTDWVGKNAANFTIPGTITLTTPAGFSYVPVFADVPSLAYEVLFTPTDGDAYDPSTKTGVISCSLAFYIAEGTIHSTDGTDGAGRIIDVEITGIVSSNLAVPSDFADVGDIFTAHRNVAAGSGDPGPANVGSFAGITYDFESEVWLYDWQPS